MNIHVISHVGSQEVTLGRSALGVCPYGDPWGTPRHFEVRCSWAPTSYIMYNDNNTIIVITCIIIIICVIYGQPPC